MSNKTTIQYMPSNGKFHRVEQSVPWGGTKCSMGWNKVFHGVEHLHTLYLLLMMLVLGSGNAWGQTDPVEITTEEEDNNNTEKLYLIQTNQFQSFYMIPKGTNVSTVNLPNEQMLWYFKNAGKDNGTQYYYIVNKFNSLYICHGGGTTDNTTSRGVTLVEKTQSNEERCKFKIVEDNTNDTEGFYNINTKANVTYFALNKQSGSVSSENNIRLTNTKYAHDLNSKWKFIRFNGTVTWSAPPFTPSTDTEKYFYKINSKINTSYNISSNYPTTDNKVTFASTSSDNMVWYFKEVPSNLAGESSSWFKYYYIVNQNSDDQYMYYDGTATDGTTQSDVVSLKEKSEGIEDRYQFIIVQTAKTTTNDAPVECYMIVPKLLREVLWDYNSIGPDAVSDGSVIDIIEGRASLKETTNNYAHVTFTLIEPCAEPTISLDPSTNKVIISTTESASSLYYTITDGIVDAETLASPTRANTQYTSPITLTSTKTIKAVTIKNNYSKAKSNPVTKTIVYNPTITFSGGPWTYDKTAKEPSISSVMVGETSIPSTDYDITYANNVNAGTTASVTIRESSTSEYLIYGTTNFTISQAPLTVTAKPKSIAYGDAPANNGVEYSGFADTDDESVLGGELAYAYSYAKFGDIGNTYTITPSGLTSDNYDITFASGTLTVNKKEVGLTWSDTPLVYNGTLQAPTATATETINNDAIEVTVSGAETNAGTGYTATASGLTGSKAGNYKLPAANTQEFTIAQAPLTVTANDKTITYGDAPANNGVEYSGFVNNETSSVLEGTLTYAYNYEQYGDVGDYTITPDGLTSGNYDITFNEGTLTVNKKEVTVTGGITASDKKYDGTTAATLDGTDAVIDGKIGTDDLTVEVESGAFADKNVGTDKTVTINSFSLGGTKAGNYQMAASGHQATTQASITPATLTVAAEAKSKTYGDTDPEFTYTSDGLIGSDEITGLLSRAEGENVGTYAINQGSLTAGGNYSISYTGANLTISAKSIGDGTMPASGITIILEKVGDDLTVSLKDGVNDLSENDYSWDPDEDNPEIIIITGQGNYEGSVQAVYAQTAFKDPDETGTGEKAAAVYKASLDLATPSGISPYIIWKVNPTIGTISIAPLEYIPEDVPVLLLSDDVMAGFTTSPKPDETEDQIPEITDGTKNSNKLKVSQGGEKVEAAQIYMFYRGEFVLTKAGTLSAGKFYLYNPNFTATPPTEEEQGGSGSESRSILQIVIEDMPEPTEIIELNNSKIEEQKTDVWYTLDGRRIEGKPTKSGIYIQKGNKMFIKRK